MNNMLIDVHSYADTATILGTVVAVMLFLVGIWRYLKSKADFKEKCQSLERFLREEKDKKIDRGQRTVPLIVAKTGLSEQEIMKCSTVNPHIQRKVTVDKVTHKATEILFEYVKDP